jgi:hypothetical protein
MTRTPKLKLFCSKCGSKADAICACGQPYITAGVAAAQGVAAYWEQSDRAIAKKIGVHYSTVREARIKLTGGNPSVDKRIGLDGKTRRLPRHDNAITPAEVVRIPAALELIEILTPSMKDLMKEGNYHVMAMSPDRVGRLAREIQFYINESLGPITRAKACEDCALEWKIDETKLNEDVIGAVRKAAHAWRDLLEKLEAAVNSSPLVTACQTDFCGIVDAPPVRPAEVVEATSEMAL